MLPVAPTTSTVAGGVVMMKVLSSGHGESSQARLVSSLRVTAVPGPANASLWHGLHPCQTVRALAYP
jgi:hypothetical protein